MDLPEFLRETQAAVRSQIRDGALFEELVFSSIVMDHMAETGMTFDPVECHYEGKVGNANLRLSGYRSRKARHSPTTAAAGCGLQARTRHHKRDVRRTPGHHSARGRVVRRNASDLHAAR